MQNLICTFTFYSLDIDECTEESDNCDANTVCTNTDGSFTCACNTGYSGDGVTCTGEFLW